VSAARRAAGAAAVTGTIGATVTRPGPITVAWITFLVIGPGRVTVAPIVPVTAAAPAARLAAAQP
jgi:flagella basal body P-ring formation protein FlgA